mmetsp:Transcript_94821/g.198119  ORF Transcript_94821/g.198119 Transcript_94821/m.198119 type:complete len:545 (-) Transcript_94821:941-2575(-)
MILLEDLLLQFFGSHVLTMLLEGRSSNTKRGELVGTQVLSGLLGLLLDRDEVVLKGAALLAPLGDEGLPALHGHLLLAPVGLGLALHAALAPGSVGAAAVLGLAARGACLARLHELVREIGVDALVLRAFVLGAEDVAADVAAVFRAGAGLAHVGKDRSDAGALEVAAGTGQAADVLAVGSEASQGRVGLVEEAVHAGVLAARDGLTRALVGVDLHGPASDALLVPDGVGVEHACDAVGALVDAAGDDEVNVDGSEVEGVEELAVLSRDLGISLEKTTDSLGLAEHSELLHLFPHFVVDFSVVWFILGEALTLGLVHAGGLLLLVAQGRDSELLARFGACLGSLLDDGDGNCLEVDVVLVIADAGELDVFPESHDRIFRVVHVNLCLEHSCDRVSRHGVRGHGRPGLGLGHQLCEFLGGNLGEVRDRYLGRGGKRGLGVGGDNTWALAGERLSVYLVFRDHRERSSLGGCLAAFGFAGSAVARGVGIDGAEGALPALHGAALVFLGRDRGHGNGQSACRSGGLSLLEGGVDGSRQHGVCGAFLS